MQCFPFNHWGLHMTARIFQIKQWFGNIICQFHYKPGMPLIRSQGLLYVQVPQVISNLIFYSGKNFIPSIPALMFRSLRDVGKYPRLLALSYLDLPSDNQGD